MIKSIILLERLCLNYVLCSVLERLFNFQTAAENFGEWQFEKAEAKDDMLCEVLSFYNGKHSKTPNNQVTKKQSNNGYAKKTPHNFRSHTIVWFPISENS